MKLCKKPDAYEPNFTKVLEVLTTEISSSKTEVKCFSNKFDALITYLKSDSSINSLEDRHDDLEWWWMVNDMMTLR